MLRSYLLWCPPCQRLSCSPHTTELSIHIISLLVLAEPPIHSSNVCCPVGFTLLTELGSPTSVVSFSLWCFWRNYSSSTNCQSVSSLSHGLSKQTVQALRAPTPSDRHCIKIYLFRFWPRLKLWVTKSVILKHLLVAFSDFLFTDFLQRKQIDEKKTDW